MKDSLASCKCAGSECGADSAAHAPHTRVPKKLQPRLLAAAKLRAQVRNSAGSFFFGPGGVLAHPRPFLGLFPSRHLVWQMSDEPALKRPSGPSDMASGSTSTKRLRSDASPAPAAASVLEAFGLFRDEIDDYNDRRERLIKTSRDVTSLSKKVIFLLHRSTLATLPRPIIRHPKIARRSRIQTQPHCRRAETGSRGGATLACQSATTVTNETLAAVWKSSSKLCRSTTILRQQSSSRCKRFRNAFEMYSRFQSIDICWAFQTSRAN